jgi:cell division protein ZapE
LATNHSIGSLLNVDPQVSTEELMAHLVPPREFRAARFENYVPDSNFASQAAAVTQAKAFLGLREVRARSLFTRKTQPKSGIYLDGGFGVGKTHLLASIWHAASGRKAFGSFLAYTGLIGVLGFAKAVQAFSRYDLICIDEFELDDPGDTMMMSRLLTELEAKGVKFAATSNTPPNALGQGRFAAADFAREISAMADKFSMISIDGEDYRHRPTEAHAESLSQTAFESWVTSNADAGNRVYVDAFDALLGHLSKLHPSKYADLVEDVDALGLKNVRQLTDQVEALRWVALIDRLYERQVRLRATGTPLTDSFSSDMLQGGYRKKYLRAISRLGAMSSQ